MNEAIGQVLSFAVGVAISPAPIIAVVLMLATPNARANGLAFLIGWIGGLATVGAVVLLISSGADASDDGEPATWIAVLKLALGLLMLLIAVRQWQGRPRDEATTEMPTWMRTIDSFRAPKALALGVLLSAVNPKNLLLTVGASAAIAQTGIAAGPQAIVLAVFVFVGTLGPGIPVAIYFAMGERAARLLDELNRWMARHNAAIMATLCLVIGAKLIGDGLSSF